MFQARAFRFGLKHNAMLDDTDDDDNTLDILALVPASVSNEHTILYRACHLRNNRTLELIFYVVAGLCDPLTQPGETDEMVLSIDCLADLVMALSYRVLLAEESGKKEAKNSKNAHANNANDINDAKDLDDFKDSNDRDDAKRVNGNLVKDASETAEAKVASDGPADEAVSDQNPKVESNTNDSSTTIDLTPTHDQSAAVALLRFTLSLRLFEILEAAQKVLRADDELRVRYLQNDKEQLDELSSFWLPQVGDSDAKILYYMCSVIIFVLYKLFPSKPYNVALNPYTDYFLRLWKTHTSIVALALEMDRELEEEAWSVQGEYFDTPENVKRALLGLSAIRTVLAYVLNQALPPVHDDNGQKKNREHDLKNLPMLDFFHPLSRTARHCGALVADERLCMVVLLILGSRQLYSVQLEQEVTFPLFDVEDYNFRRNARQSFLGAAGDLIVDTYHGDQFDEDIKYVFGYYDSDEESEAALEMEDVAMALRTKNGIEFDDNGRDWRDCVRGENVEFTEEFLELDARYNALVEKSSSNDFIGTWDDVKKALEFLEQLDMENSATFLEKMGQVYANTIAKAIKDEDTETDCDINPDKLYKFFVSPAPAMFLDGTHQRKTYLIQLRRVTNFELVLVNNPTIAFSMLDELFMCPGLRRSLIWYLTHGINLHMSLINYIYELAVGLRGNNPDRPSNLRFSRKGGLLVLSPIERLMLLHEFFMSASCWLFQGEFDSSTELPELRAKKLVSYMCLMILMLISRKVIVFDRSDADFFEDYSQDLQVLLFPWIGKVPEARELFFSIKKQMYPSEPAQIENLTEPAERPNNIYEALEDLEKLSDKEIYKYAVTDKAMDVFTDFARRIFYHICKQHNITISESDFNVTTLANDDFALFLANYNQLARCNHFVLLLFDLLRPEVIGDRPGREEEEDEGEEDTRDHVVDSEFNDEFLNGEGQFQERISVEKKKKTKKKKSKKKKK